MTTAEEARAPGQPSRRSRSRRLGRLAREPLPGAAPWTLMVEPGEKSRIFLIDYGKSGVVEKELASIDEAIPHLTDGEGSITWVDLRGLGDRQALERMGEILKIHPLALEDVVNVPQRPKSEVYTEHHLVISRAVELSSGSIQSEQIGIIFGKGYVLTVQEDPRRDCLERVRERIRAGRGAIRTEGADYLAYAVLDAVIDGFYPVLEQLGERLEDLEVDAAAAPRGMPRRIHDVKRDLLAARRAIWPQRDLLNSLLRDDSPHVTRETRTFLRDPYDHAVQVMDMVETFREIASGLMDLYLSGVSNRMNEIMKVLTVISTIFLPLTFIAGVYGMNFDHNASPYNLPELTWRYGYPFALALMLLSALGLLWYYRRKGWLGVAAELEKPEADPASIRRS